MKDDYSRKGTDPPTEDDARNEILSPTIGAPDLITVEDFLRFYVATSRPWLDTNKPTVDSINTVAEWFFAGFTRVTGTETDEEDRGEVYNVRSRSGPQTRYTDSDSGCGGP